MLVGVCAAQQPSDGPAAVLFNYPLKLGKQPATQLAPISHGMVTEQSVVGKPLCLSNVAK